VVTVVGVASRGQIPLQDIRVGFQVEPVASADARGFGVRKTVTLHGALSATEQRRLQRAAEYCPVGQLFTKGALTVEDQVACDAKPPNKGNHCRYGSGDKAASSKARLPLVRGADAPGS
jgi:hypothetical protein